MRFFIGRRGEVWPRHDAAGYCPAFRMGESGVYADLWPKLTGYKIAGDPR
jgi:hypothetical protein